MTKEIKLEVGKQYKTRGGWRCVVVMAYDDGTVDAWHEDDENVWAHEPNGLYAGDDKTRYDIIAEWKEPRKGVAWLYVFEDGEMIARDEEEIDIYNGKLISVTRVEWEENQ